MGNGSSLSSENSDYISRQGELNFTSTHSVKVTSINEMIGGEIKNNGILEKHTFNKKGI